MKKTLKSLIWFIISISLFVISLSLCLVFTLYTINKPQVKINNVAITSVENQDTNRYSLSTVISLTPSHTSNVDYTVKFYFADNLNTTIGSTNIKVNLNRKQNYTKNLTQYMYLSSLNYTADDFYVEVIINNIEKLTTTLNYIGYGLIPASSLLLGFSVYTLVDLIKCVSKNKKV